nr:RHS repeat-associated core domain-containing protein [Luteibacter rhizovicinus]
MEETPQPKTNRRNIERHASVATPAAHEPVAGAGGIHSNAYNFLSAVNTGVDPRTGMYSCSISLPGVAANNLCGPAANVGLSFSALNPIDEGFGVGWSLTTTRYDTRRRRLSLSSGESFMVDAFVGAVATFKDRKLRTFDLLQRGPDDYVIVHKSGTSEWLRVILGRKKNKGSDGVAMLYEVRSPEGYPVTFEQTAPNGIARLHRVWDGTGRVLLTVDYEIDATVLTLHPESVQAAAFTLHFKNDRLVRLALPEGYGEGWSFDYQGEAAVLLLKSVTVPTGGREEVDYKLEGHVLPGGAERPLSHMPVVIEYRRDPGHEQPVMRTHYAYSEQNFFGYGAVDDWLNDKDNLYRIVAEPGRRYEYSSIETHYDDLAPVRTVERVFNRFHLLTSERSVQDGCVKEVITTYEEDPAISFEDQLSWCQLPVEVRTLYYRETPADRSNAGTRRFREMARKTRYDAHGNVLEATDERGATEVYDYFPAKGEPGLCPVDPLGFVRFLREKRVDPPAGADGPVRLTRYTYKELPSRVVGASIHIVPWTETLYTVHGDGTEVELGKTSQYFIGDRGPDHGRLERLVSRHGGVESSVDHAYDDSAITRDASGRDVPVLTTTSHKIASNGQDSQHATSVTARSYLSGLPVMDRSPGGVVMRYSHDALGRQVAETVAADSDWAATTSTTFVLTASGARIVKRSVTGQETATELDGFGTALRVLAINAENDLPERDIWRASFDGMGRKVGETVTDSRLPIAAVAPPYAADAIVSTTEDVVETTTRYVYDGWDNVKEIHGADGVIGYHVVDPVDGVAERWQEVEGPEGRMRSGRTRITQTTSGKPARTDTLDADGNVCLSQHASYDGLDRLISDVVVAPGEPDRVSHYRYDDFDRLIETIRPDGAVITTDYAAYTGDALAVAIWIQHASLGPEAILLGEQAYDGLARRTSLLAGPRKTTYHFEGPVSAKPDSMTLPSGETVAFRHQAHLGDAMLEAIGADGVTAFTYDTRTGETLSVTNGLGRHTIEYDASGRVSAETFQHEGVVGERGCSYRYSLRGVPTEYTDVNGDPHRLMYDELGRFVRMENGDMSVDVGYDAFSRAHRTLSQSRDGARSMDVHVSFDEQDREESRVVTARSGTDVAVQTLSQAYTAAGKLLKRQRVRDGSVRDETFIYDLRDRLAAYSCAGVHGPKDDSGHPLSGQAFEYDALDNVVTLVTTYLDGFPSETRHFVYAKDDATRLHAISIERGGLTVDELVFTYDQGGNLLYDEKGRRLRYDAVGRPAGWSLGDAHRDYRYDALGQIGTIHDGQDERHRYYVGGQISREEGEGTSATFHHVQGEIVAQTRTTGGSDDVILLGGDSQGSVIAEAGASVAALAYTSYGYRDATEGSSDIGYTGELKERNVDWYVLGHYRAYNPTLLRFHSPDAASPFAHGLLNAYAYCSGDPINRSDPGGEGWLDWLFVGIGVIASGIAIAASGGTLAPAIGAVVSLTATASQATAVGLVAVDVTSIGLAIGSAAASDAGNDALAGKLGLASMVLGLGGLGATVGPTLATQAIKGGKTFLAATKYVRPPAIRSPLALKAPRLRGGGDVTDLSRFTISRPRPMPSDDALRAMNGFERVNTATRDVGMRRHMISRGFISPQLLARFPEGIDLTSRSSVMSARHTLSMALVDAEGLTPGMLAQTGFDAEALAYLNPSLLSGQPLNLPDDELRALLKRPYGRVVEEGEHLYAMFLETGNLGYLARYGRTLLQARITNRWSRWNSPSNFVL